MCFGQSSAVVKGPIHHKEAVRVLNIACAGDVQALYVPLGDGCSECSLWVSTQVADNSRANLATIFSKGMEKESRL